jgi:hypothetical protein
VTRAGGILAEPGTHLADDAGAPHLFATPVSAHLMGHWSRDLGARTCRRRYRRRPADGLFGIGGAACYARVAADLMLFDPRTVARGASGGARLPAGAARSPPRRSAARRGSAAPSGDPKGFCVDKTARPGAVIRQFAS